MKGKAGVLAVSQDKAGVRPLLSRHLDLDKRAVSFLPSRTRVRNNLQRLSQCVGELSNGQRHHAVSQFRIVRPGPVPPLVLHHATSFMLY